MKHKPIAGKMMGIPKASKGMGATSTSAFSKRGTMNNAPKRHVMNKLKR